LAQGFSGGVEGGVVLLADGRLVLALGTGLLVRQSGQHDVITGHKYSMIKSEINPNPGGLVANMTSKTQNCCDTKKLNKICNPP
jgi:hypothetical protein